MRKAKLIVSSLCIVAVLALAMPTAAYATDDPQGGVKSTRDAPPPPPPPPPPSAGLGILGTIVAFLLS
jgi:hypothetical protein